MTHIIKQPPKHYCLRPDDFGYGAKYHDWSCPQIGDVFQVGPQERPSREPSLIGSTQCDECGQMWQYTKNDWWRVLNYAGEAEWRKVGSWVVT
jgi:hypothetical protein